jgi:hypothetical protein
MPKISERKKIINEIEQVLILQKLIDSSSEESSSDIDEHLDDDDDNLQILYEQIQCNRYLELREHIARAPDHLDWLLFQLDEKRFKQEIRITRYYFQELLAKIENHPIFQNRTCNKQRPVYHQLLVTMKRFGTYGNGAAIGIIARYFSLSGNDLFFSCNISVFVFLSYFFFPPSLF